MTDPPLPESLPAALQALDLQLPEEQVVKLDQYRSLLWQWNESINLTRHTDFTSFASRDLVDSIQLAQLLAQGEDVLDVGSGGGVPGIILAILRPDLEISLSDSVGKKAKVLEAIVDELKLPVAVHHCRAESLLDDFRFHSIVARAVGPMWKICSWFDEHWQSVERLLLIKGPRWPEERTEARKRGLIKKLDLRKVAEYPMAGTYSQSVILQLTRKPNDEVET